MWLSFYCCALVFVTAPELVLDSDKNLEQQYNFSIKPLVIHLQYVSYVAPTVVTAVTTNAAS